MRDKFLYKIRPPMREAFSKNLYQRLSRLEFDNLDQQKEGKGMKNLNKRNLTWRYALLTFLVVAALTLTISEPVRAKALELIQTIAGINVEEQSESPLKDIEEENVETYTIPTLALSKALENSPFQFGLPTWVPEGYVLDENVANAESWISLVWNNSNLSEIQMLVEREYNGYSIPAGENSSEEIKINGTPALLVRGFWNAQDQWDPTLGIVIGWEKDGHFYRLTYYERESSHNTIKPIEGDMDAIINELIRMAESIQ